MINFDQSGDFSVYVDGDFLTVFSGVTYGKVLDLMLPLHSKYPDVQIEIRLNGD